VQPADYRAEGLLAAFAAEELRGARILLPRAAGARAILPETLRARGAQVDEVIAYRAVPPADADVDGLRAALEAGRLDALTFTSSSTVRNFGALLGEAELKRLVRDGRPVVACIGPVTAATARECGLPVTVVPRTYTAAALVGERELPRLVRDGRPVVACIGPVTAETARECGLPVTVVPPTYTAAALAAALVDHFCHAPAGAR